MKSFVTLFALWLVSFATKGQPATVRVTNIGEYMDLPVISIVCSNTSTNALRLPHPLDEFSGQVVLRCDTNAYLLRLTNTWRAELMGMSIHTNLLPGASITNIVRIADCALVTEVLPPKKVSSWRNDLKACSELDVYCTMPERKAASNVVLLRTTREPYWLR